MLENPERSIIPLSDREYTKRLAQFEEQLVAWRDAYGEDYEVRFATPDEIRLLKQANINIDNATAHENPLEDLTGVGATKALGYLTFNAINQLGGNVEQLIQDAESKGLYTKVFEGTISNTLYIADLKALDELIQKNENTTVLIANNWPTDPQDFIDHSTRVSALHNTSLFNFIADTFEDRTNPGRTDVNYNDPYRDYDDIIYIEDQVLLVKKREDTSAS